jgi:hypothetical protein
VPKTLQFNPIYSTGIISRTKELFQWKSEDFNDENQNTCHNFLGNHPKPSTCFSRRYRLSVQFNTSSLSTLSPFQHNPLQQLSSDLRSESQHLDDLRDFSHNPFNFCKTIQSGIIKK